MQSKQGKLFIISGPSGVGKGTVIKALLEKIPDLVLSVSVTTRPPRDYEAEGKDYYFTDRTAFSQMQDDGGFLECAEHYGTFYGTPRTFVDNKLEEGKSVLLEIDTEGAFQVKEKMPQSVSVFLAYPSLDELRDRLTKRGSETEASLELRLDKAVKEYGERKRYDYVVVNDVLENTVEQIIEIFKGELKK